jgi:hypothetical protein
MSKTSIEELKLKADEVEKAYQDQEAERAAQLSDISEEQYKATTQTIVDALETLNEQIAQARTNGSDRGKDIIKAFGGENKFATLIENMAGYMGEAVATGVTLSTTPMVVMAGTAKGIYKKVTE